MTPRRPNRYAFACTDLDVIVVDDETPFRTSLVEILRDDGHRVSDYGRASAVPLGRPSARPTALVADYGLAGLDGIELAEAFHDVHPDGVVVLLSPWRTTALEARLAQHRFIRFLQKPVDYDVLHDVLHGVAR
ncbi:MAG TPA: response regulator [Candidatus Limnocylindria bacterium]|nr:response regulator [Candidatus Limnocylindria bacterium]